MKMITRKQSLSQANIFFKKIKTSLKKREPNTPTVNLDLIFLILSKLEEQFLADIPFSIVEISEIYEMKMDQNCPECGLKVRGNLNHFCFDIPDEILHEITELGEN